MIPPIQSPNFLSEWTDAIVNLQLENIKILLNFDPQLLWTYLPYTLDHENKLYIELIQTLRLGNSVQPLSALQYCIIQYNQPESREEKYKIISYLIEQATSEDLNTHYWGDCNNSTLHLVCFMGQLDVLDLLLKKDASISIKNNLGFSPCHVASSQAILDGFSFYEQKKEQQQQHNPGTNNTVLQKFKMLRDLAEGSMNNKKASRPNFNRHYFRTGHVQEAKKFLTAEVHDEKKAQLHIQEVAQLAKKSAVKNNLKQFEGHEDSIPQQQQQQEIMHRSRLPFHPIVEPSESFTSKRDSAIISSLKKNNLVSSSTLRQQINDCTGLTEESSITELYSSRPSTIIEERQSNMEEDEESNELDDGMIDSTTEEEHKENESEALFKDILEVSIKQEEETSVPIDDQPDAEPHPSTTESILDEYTPTESKLSNNDSLDIEMCRKVLHETKIIENEIDLLLAETKGSPSDDVISCSSSSSDDNQDNSSLDDGDDDGDSIYIMHEEPLKDSQFIEIQKVKSHQELEQDESLNSIPTSPSITLSSPTPSFYIDHEYDSMKSRKHSGGSQKTTWTTSLLLWSSNLDDTSHRSKDSNDDQFSELIIEEKEEVQLQQYPCIVQDVKGETGSEVSNEEEEDLRKFRNTLDITDEDMMLMIRSSSIRRAAEKGNIHQAFRSSAELNAGLLSTEDLLSNTSSARSSSSIKTMDAILYTPPNKKQQQLQADNISDFYPPPPPPPPPPTSAMPVIEMLPGNYHTREEKQGKLNLHICGIQDIRLPLPKEPTLVRCVVSDGRFEYISDYKKLDYDIEFDHKCSIDVYPGMSITISLHVHPDCMVSSKVQPLRSILKRHRHCFSNYISQVDGAIGLAFCDISNCLSVCREEYYRASICCFNTWYAKSFIERHTRKWSTLNEKLMDIAGKFDLDMFYSPVK